MKRVKYKKNKLMSRGKGLIQQSREPNRFYRGIHLPMKQSSKLDKLKKQKKPK